MKEMRTGIESRNSYLRNVKANYNHIDASWRGINWIKNTGAQLMQAEHNVINMEGDPAACAIRISENNTSVTAHYSIYDNEINLTDVTTGILASGAVEPRITYNNITHNTNTGTLPNNTVFGIRLDATDKADLACNYITSNYDNNLRGSFGIHVNQSTNSSIKCNKTYNHHYGVFFGAQCGGTNFITNKMHDHFEGLHLNGNAEIGTQVHNGNLWLGTYTSGFGANNLNSGPQGLSDSKFTVNTISGTTLHPDVPAYDMSSPTGGTDWFLTDIFGTPLSCGSASTCNAQLEVNTSFSYEKDIAEDSTLTVDYPDESKSMSKQYLYELLNENDSLLQSDSAFIHFFNTQKQTVIGKLNEVKEKITSSEIDYYLLQQLLACDSLIAAKYDSIALIDSVNTASPIPNYSELKTQLLQAISTLQLTQQNILLQQLYTVRVKADSAYALNSIIQPVEIPEQNQSFANTINLLYALYGPDTLFSYWNQMLAVAQQCPYSGGPAVYVMRELIEDLSDSVFIYNDDITCLQEGIFREHESLQEFDDSELFSIIPNPASNELTIHVNYAHEGSCSIVLENTLSEKIKVWKIDCSKKEHHLNVSMLTPGVYFVSYIINDKRKITRKLVIIK